MAEVQRDNLGSREDTMRFIDMVGLFGSQAMMALGKVINPTTQKAEKNLNAARLFIDTLDMLERKTRGNLTPDEEKVLRSTLTDLRLMFAEEAKASDAEKANETPPPASPEMPAVDDAEEDKVKFHKSYGDE